MDNVTRSGYKHQPIVTGTDEASSILGCLAQFGKQATAHGLSGCGFDGGMYRGSLAICCVFGTLSYTEGSGSFHLKVRVFFTLNFPLKALNNDLNNHQGNKLSTSLPASFSRSAPLHKTPGAAT